MKRIVIQKPTDIIFVKNAKVGQGIVVRDQDEKMVGYVILDNANYRVITMNGLFITNPYAELETLILGYSNLNFYQIN